MPVLCDSPCKGLCSAACEQVPDQGNDPKDRKNVDKKARAMSHKLAHQPKYEQNTGNTKEHIDLLRCLLAAGMRTNT